MYMLHLIMLPSHSLPPFFVPARVPPLAFQPLYLLISSGFGTKSHLGKTTCQLRWVFTLKKTASPQHLSVRIKDISVSPLNSLPLSPSPLMPLSLFLQPKPHIHYEGIMLNEHSQLPPVTSLSPPLSLTTSTLCPQGVTLSPTPICCLF